VSECVTDLLAVFIQVPVIRSLQTSNAYSQGEKIQRRRSWRFSKSIDTPTEDIEPGAG